MALYERYELLELRRDDGIQTFHARDISTARPVQIHLFPENPPPAMRQLLARLDHLPDAEHRRVIECGDDQGRPYVITDRLAGYAGFQEWLISKTDPASRHAALDDQFYQLFDPYAETAALTVSPFAGPIEPVGPIATEPPVSRTGQRKRVGRSLTGILLGIVAAIVLLTLIVAGLAFLPR